MEYFKCSSPVGQYTDVVARVTIRRGEVIAIKQPTKGMKPYILKGGIVKVSQSEYEAWAAKQAKPVKESIPQDQLPKVEQTEGPVEAVGLEEKPVVSPLAARNAFFNKGKPAKQAKPGEAIQE